MTRVLSISWEGLRASNDVSKQYSETYAPSILSILHPNLSMARPMGNVRPLSRNEPMVKARFRASSCALHRGYVGRPYGLARVVVRMVVSSKEPFPVKYSTPVEFSKNDEFPKSPSSGKTNKQKDVQTSERLSE